MKKVVNSVKDIPDWFSLKNYEFTSSLNAAGWFAQLYPRYLWRYIASLSNNPDLSQFKLGLSNKDAAQEFLSTIVSNSGKLPIEVVRFLVPVLDRSPESDPYSIKSITVRSVRYLNYDFNNSIPDKFIEHLDKDTLSPEETALSETPYAIWLANAGYTESYEMVPIDVNLSATDEQLKLDFEKWLINFRKLSGKTAESKNFSDSKFQRWHKLRLLPFLDLSYWAMLESKSITQPVYGAILFPDEFDKDTTYKVRTSLIPLAKIIREESTMQALRAQASTGNMDCE